MINKNELPKHWKWVKIGDVCEVVRGGSPRPAGDSRFYNGNIPFLKVADLTKDSNIYLNSHQYTIKVEGLKKTRKINPQTLLLTNSGATLGVPKISLIEATINDGIAAFLNLNPRSILYLYYFWLTKTKELRNINQGAAQPNLNTEIIKNVEIPLPPLAEQERIVAKIEELFSELDAGIASLKTAQAQLKTYRQAVLKYAFEGKLTNENVNEGELPKGWKWVNIIDLAEPVKNALKAGPFGSSLKKEFYTESGYKIYGQEQVINGDPYFGDYYVSEEKYQELNSNKIKPFDVLISLVGTVGKVLILPENCKAGIINPRLIKISLDTKKYLPHFFKYYFESSTVKSFYSSKAQGTTMDVLNLGIIKTIPFPLCSFEEQQRIVGEIESRLNVCDKLEETITASLKQSEALRQSILKQAFEGKLVQQTSVC